MVVAAHPLDTRLQTLLDAVNAPPSSGSLDLLLEALRPLRIILPPKEPVTNAVAKGKGVDKDSRLKAQAVPLVAEGGAQEVEVAFRTRMHDLVTKMNKEELSLEISGVPNLLTLALRLATHEGKIVADQRGQFLCKLPLLLLEDYLDSQGTESCKEMWGTWVEGNSAELTAEPILSRGKYVLLRVCNGLVSRLSKTHDASFCGQVLMFLSRTFPISERSSVNVKGTINVENTTDYEDEEGFNHAARYVTGEGDGTTTVNRACVGQQQSTMDVDTEGGGGDGEEGLMAVDYALYRSFWSLQDHVLKQEGVVKGPDAPATWAALLNSVDKVLSSFEANSFSVHDLCLAREKWNRHQCGQHASGSSGATGDVSSTPLPSLPVVGSKRGRGDDMDVDGGDWAPRAGRGVGGGRQGEGDYFGLKYLTNSRLLRLQLKDPTLRLQVLSQWLILAMALRQHHAILGGDSSPQINVEDLLERSRRAKRLMVITPPNGKEYLEMLDKILTREGGWISWKKGGCKAFEKFPTSATKRRRVGGKEGGVVSDPDADKVSEMHAPMNVNDLPGHVQRMKKEIPVLEDFLSDQRECMGEEEVPIEDMPSSHPLYSWRALRLMSSERPQNLDRCFKGNLIEAIKKMDGLHQESPAEAVEDDGGEGGEDGTTASASMGNNEPLEKGGRGTEGTEQVVERLTGGNVRTGVIAGRGGKGGEEGEL